MYIMSEQRNNLALWLATALYYGIEEQTKDSRAWIGEMFLEAVRVSTDAENPLEHIDKLENITLPELQSVVIFLKASRNPAFREKRTRVVLNITLKAIDAAFIFTDNNSSTKRKRVD